MNAVFSKEDCRTEVVGNNFLVHLGLLKVYLIFINTCNSYYSKKVLKQLNVLDKIGSPHR